MIIYRILNLIDSKCYIGQTKFDSFKQRYWGKWYKSTHNEYLKNAVTKHGEENFVIQILESNIGSLEELDKLEAFYIKKFDSLYPSGYNFLDGGNSNHSLHDITKEKISQKLAKNFILVDYKGDVHKIINLKRFCRNHNLSYAAMKNMIQGQTLSSQGFSLDGTDMSLIQNPNKEYKLKNLNSGEVVIFSSIRKFALERGLEANYLQKLLKNKRKTPYKGWVTLDMDLEYHNKQMTYIGKKLISPEGIIYEITESPYSFAKKHLPLDRKDIYMLINKETNERKGGWKLYE